MQTRCRVTYKSSSQTVNLNRVEQSVLLSAWSCLSVLCNSDPYVGKNYQYNQTANNTVRLDVNKPGFFVREIELVPGFVYQLMVGRLDKAFYYVFLEANGLLCPLKQTS